MLCMTIGRNKHADSLVCGFCHLAPQQYNAHDSYLLFTQLNHSTHVHCSLQIAFQVSQPGQSTIYSFNQFGEAAGTPKRAWFLSNTLQINALLVIGLMNTENHNMERYQKQLAWQNWPWDSILKGCTQLLQRAWYQEQSTIYSFARGMSVSILYTNLGNWSITITYYDGWPWKYATEQVVHNLFY